MNPCRISLLLYLLALLLVGIGHLAILPPFEGGDEKAHFSSMRQIAGTGTLPVLGESVLDRAHTEYQGPQPYSAIAQPFDSGLVYSKFFAQPELVEKYRRLYREAPFSTSYAPGQGLNWEAQHPPLYYLAMAPVVNAVSGLSFVSQFFVLRLASFLLALGGVVFGLLAVEKNFGIEEKDAAFLGVFLYPLVFPVFFTEFARLSNDALCVFLVGILAYLLALWRRNPKNMRLSVAVGVTLGLGLLTKGLFVPVVAALAAFLFFRLWRDRGAKDIAHKRAALIGIFYPALVIGGVWYIGRLALHGDLSGGVDSLALAQHGGWIAGLGDHFSLYAFARSVLATLFSYSWAGTWSYAFLPLAMRAPLVVLSFWIFGVCVFELKKRRGDDFAWLPVWLFVFFAGGMFYHLMLGIALDGMGHTPGWYLHVLMPFVAPAMGAGAVAILQKPRARVVLIAFLVYAFLFQIAANWAQFALFAGCATKADDESYAFSSPVFCFDQAATMADRMSVLGWPALAAFGFGGGALCAVALVLQKTGVWGRARRRFSS
jgi:hypothetical protein